MYQAYQPSTLGHTILALVFYVLMAVYIIYSLIGLYALLRFGRSVIVSLLVSILYLIITVSLYAAAITNLHNI
jgi:hypothetical protein